MNGTVFRRRVVPTGEGGSQGPSVLVAMEPRLFGQALGQLLDRAGFRVARSGGHVGPVSASGFDAVVVSQGTEVSDGRVVVSLDQAGKAMVEFDGETGFITVDHPGDVVALLRSLLVPDHP